MGFPLPLFLHRFLKQVILLFCLSFSISNTGIRTLSFLGPILRTNPLLSTEYCDDCHWKLRNRCNPQCAFTRLSVDKECIVSLFPAYCTLGMENYSHIKIIAQMLKDKYQLYHRQGQCGRKRAKIEVSTWSWGVVGLNLSPWRRRRKRRC